MNSLFGTQLYQNVLGISLILWVIVEYRVILKEGKRPQKKDIKAILFFFLIIFVFTSLSIYVFSIGIGNVSEHQGFLFWFGICILLIGVLFRQISIRYMGKFYVATLQVQEKPKLIKEGIFKIIRHPCYSGFMVALWGLGLTTLNWVFFIEIFIFSLGIFLIQIAIEERQLEVFFGEEYTQYKKQTKKLIPFVI